MTARARRKATKPPKETPEAKAQREAAEAEAERLRRREIVLRICEVIAADKRSLTDICAAEEWAPPEATVRRWRDADPELVAEYTRAREHRAEYLEEEMQRVADDGSRDYLLGEDGVVVMQEHIQRSRLIVDTLKWRLGRMHPKKYGDKLDVTSGDKPLAPTERQVIVINGKEFTF